jgi:excisionase family DNA binding protein
MDVLIPLQRQRKELYMAVEEKSNDIQAISEKRTHSVQEIADILQISRSMAYNLCRQQLFKTVKIGKYVRVSKSSFDEWLDNQN